MRRLAIIALLWLLSSAAYETEAQPGANCPGAPTSRLIVGERARVIPETGMNMRVLPSTDAQRLTILPGGAELRVLDGPYCTPSFAWWEVDDGIRRGWIAEAADGEYLVEPFILLPAQAGSIRLEYPQQLLSRIVALRLSEGSPGRARFLLFGWPDALLTSPNIEVFPAAEASDELLRLASAAEGEDPASIFEELGLLAAQPLRLAFANGTLLRFLTLEADRNNTLRVLYRVVGRDRDGQLMLNAALPLTAPDLPALPAPDPNAREEANAELLNEALAALVPLLATLSPAQIAPDLALIDRMFTSLNFTAPPRDVPQPRDYRYGDRFRLRYQPELARYLIGGAINATEGMPAHLRIDLEGYLVSDYERSPAIYVYRTEALNAVSSNPLPELRALLAARPSDVGGFAYLPYGTLPYYFRASARYLRFDDGGGVRFITALAGTDASAAVSNRMLFYTFQGISDGGDFYVSIILPVHTPLIEQIAPLAEEDFGAYLDALDAILHDAPAEAFTPPLDWLDAMIGSLHLGASGPG